MTNILTTGTTYCLDEARLLGWTEGDGSGHEGYFVSDYFTPAGVYLGPDKHRIEPLIEGAIDLSDNPEITAEMFAKSVTRRSPS